MDLVYVRVIFHHIALFIYKLIYRTYPSGSVMDGGECLYDIPS